MLELSKFVKKGNYMVLIRLVYGTTHSEEPGYRPLKKSVFFEVPERALPELNKFLFEFGKYTAGIYMSWEHSQSSGETMIKGESTK